MEIDGIEYAVYDFENRERARAAQAAGGAVLLQRHCSECGDALLGVIDDNPEVHCEEGHCGTRSGVSYINVR